MKKTNVFNEVNELFNTIDSLGINTIDDLMLNAQLYERTFLVLQKYISYCLTSKTHRNRKGKLICGNFEKSQMVIDNTAISRHDIEMDALIKVMDKFNMVLASQHHAYYIYTIVNNFINDLLRDLDLKLVYLDTPVNENDENACTIGALIPDYKYNPEATLIQKESIEDLEILLEKKQHEELLQKQNEMVRASKILANPAEFFSYISLYTNEFSKNRQFKALLMESSSSACETVLKKASEKYKVNLTYKNSYSDADLDKLFKKHMGEKSVAAEISRLRNRASNKLK